MRALTATLVLATLATACGPTTEDTGPQIRPHLSPVNLGNKALLTGENPDPGCGVYAPCTWNLQLLSIGTQTVNIRETCLLGDSRNAFVVEGPDINEIVPEDAAIVRFTYEPPSAGSEIDQVALVVQSNADNFPTLVVPLCGRGVPEGEVGNYDPFECVSPVTVEAGATDDSLCQ